jgi:hypothetical protein
MMGEDAAGVRGHEQIPISAHEDPARLHAAGKAAAAMRRSTGREAELELLGAILGELAELRVTSTAAAARGRNLVNGILDNAWDFFDSTGQITRTYGVAAGSIVILNPTSAPVTMHAAPPGAGAPLRGRGMQIVPAFSYWTMPLGTRAWTAYGTAGNALGWQTFTGLQPYGVAG